MHDGAPPRDHAGGPATSPASDPSHPAGAPDLQQVARDWITLWQSELTAAATDREVQETWQTLAGMWAGIAAAMVQAMPRGGRDGSGHDGGGPPTAGAAAPARAAPAAAAPDARDAEIDRLARRIADLERRLADVERGNNGGGG
jgi:hypothetical protein